MLNFWDMKNRQRVENKIIQEMDWDDDEELGRICTTAISR